MNSAATNLSVLIVEDEVLLLEAINRKLNNSGAQTISCTTGQQALDYLENLVTLPDIIWLDYYLKDMNGLEFVTKIKQNQKLKNIPIVIVSNSAGPDIIHTMLTLGANKYLLKSEYRLDEIVKIIYEIKNET